MSTMRIDQKYGKARVSILIKHWKLLRSFVDRGLYTYQELVQNKANMFKSLYQKRKLNVYK